MFRSVGNSSPRSLEELGVGVPGQDASRQGAERGTEGDSQLTDIWRRICLWEPEDLLDGAFCFLYLFIQILASRLGNADHLYRWQDSSPRPGSPGR